MPIRNIFVIALSAILSMMCYSTATKSRYASLFAEALDTIEQQALQNFPKEDLFVFAMDGMTSKLDGHSRYISGKMFKEFNEDLEQQFGGVGMYVENNPVSDRLTVLAPIPDAPAFESGIRAGDTILEIEGKSTTGMDRTEAVKLIRGPKGESVNVLMGRNGTEKHYDLIRDFIYEPSVHGDFRNSDGSWNYYLKDYPRVGYIRLRQFGSKSADEMKSAIQEIENAVDSLIIDLRNNGGGVLDGAIEICDMFLEKGETIVSTRGRNHELLDTYFSRVSSSLPGDTSLVILVNRNSASASEIVSGCLQDHKRATVIGESTWGKGTVQHIIPIERGRSALKLTTSSYWRPSGKNIDRYEQEAQKSGVWGVQPDEGMSVDLTEEDIFQNQRRRNFLGLRGLLTPEELEERDDDKLSEIVDEPLQRAIKHLLKSAEDRVAA